MSREQGPHAKRGDATVANVARRRRHDMWGDINMSEAET